MTIKEIIETKIDESLEPEYLLVENESHFHSVPPDSETHFKVTVVSGDFCGMALLQRHRRMNGILREELAGPVHALALHTFTPQEWRDRGGRSSDSPACRGGSRTDARPLDAPGLSN